MQISFRRLEQDSADLGRWTRGGVCILISARWVFEILHEGSLVDNRAVYVIFQFENTTIGVFNVYAPTSPGLRRTFWT